MGAKKPAELAIHDRGNVLSQRKRQTKGKGVKSQHTDVVAETHLVAAQKAVTLGEGGTEEVLRRARHALEVQDAERRAYNGLKSVGCGAVVPRPTLQLSSMDELVTSFRNGLPGAEKSFKNYSIRSAANDLKGHGVSDLIHKPVDATAADVDCAVSGPNIPVDAVDTHGPEYRRRLIKAINSGNGSALDHFATALCQVIKPTVSTDAPPAVPPAGTEFLHSSWTLEVKDTYTWYSGYDVVHGMSYIHPLVLHDFVPVHPLYHGDSPRVKWQGPIGKLPRMDPSKDYLRASLQYLRACAVKVGNLPCPPMQVQKLVARQYQHFESMLDRVREVRRQQQPGGGPMHKNVRVNPMIGRKALLLTPLLFSPRHLLVGEDPSGQSEREFVSRRNFTPVSPGTSALLIPADAQEESKTREPIVSLYDKDLEQPLYRGKRPLRTSDMPPPYPVFKANEPLVGKRKVVYRTRVPESTAPVAPGDSAMSRRSKAGGPLAQVPNAPLPPPRAAPPLTQKELNAINRKKERELRAYERRMRLRAEMGEEAWAAEQRRKEGHKLMKKRMYATNKNCRDAIGWAKRAARVPIEPEFGGTIFERMERAVEIVRQLGVRRRE